MLKRYYRKKMIGFAVFVPTVLVVRIKEECFGHMI
jgi:hypothetical protein